MNNSPDRFYHVYTTGVKQKEKEFRFNDDF